MSIGFMVEPDQPVILRGPMLHGAIHQMLRDTAWGPLDYLIIDMPPGTGDIALIALANPAAYGSRGRFARRKTWPSSTR